MKSAIESLLLLLAVAMFAVPESPKYENTTELDVVKLTELRPDWDWADIAKRSPVCDCEGKCDCAEPCLCNTVEERKLVVGPPPDQVKITTLASGGELFTQPQIKQVALVDEKYTHPTPQPVKAPPAATGRWVTQYAGFRGRRSYQVWVPDVGAGCSSGSCAAPASYYRGSCSSCR